jgi:hypothetical protein
MRLDLKEKKEGQQQQQNLNEIDILTHVFLV